MSQRKMALALCLVCVCVCLRVTRESANKSTGSAAQTKRSEFAERIDHSNDPSAGSPTETLLRLLLPLSDKVHQTFHCNVRDPNIAAVRIIHRITQSVGATGGVYKGQGRNQHELMPRAY